MKKLVIVLVFLLALLVLVACNEETPAPGTSETPQNNAQNNDNAQDNDSKTPDRQACTHTWGDWTAETPASCSAQGSEKRTCTVCRASESRATDKLAHTPVTDAAVANSCLTDGKTEGSHCSVCRDVLVAQTTIPAIGSHTWGDWTAETPASCSAQGSEKRTCTVCRASESRATDKLAHTPVTDAAVANSCLTDGKTEGSHCSVCRDVLVAQTTIPAIGSHNYESKLVKPTFTKEGYTEHVCSVCGDRYQDNVVSKLNAKEVADSVLASFGRTPNVFDFFPEAFAKEKLAGSAYTPDYNNVLVSGIPGQYFGKQMNVIYESVFNAQDILGYVDIVYGSADAIATLYMQYLNTNPENTATFSGTAAGFSFTLEMNEQSNKLTARFTDKVVITLVTSGNKCIGQAQIVGGNRLKFEYEENHLKLAISVLNAALVQMEFVRTSGTVTGYLYEYLTVAGKDLISTSAMITINSNYVTVVGTKGDFNPSTSKANRNVELYSAKTAQFLSSKVYEETTIAGVGAKYYTYWFPIDDVSGITSVKKVDEANGMNPDTVYINGSTSVFAVEFNKLPIVGTKTSRWFDIEFKTVYSYKVNEDGKVEKFSYEVPMIFVQEDHLDDFIAKMKSLNSSAFSTTPVLNTPKATISAVDLGFTVMIEAYNQIKDLVTREMILQYLGLPVSEE